MIDLVPYLAMVVLVVVSVTAFRLVFWRVRLAVERRRSVDLDHRIAEAIGTLGSER